VPCYEIDEICEKSVGKEQVLKEAINAVRCSKGKILMPGAVSLHPALAAGLRLNPLPLFV